MLGDFGGRTLHEVCKAADRKLRQAIPVATPLERELAIDVVVPDLLSDWPDYPSSKVASGDSRFHFAVKFLTDRARRPLRRAVHERQQTIGLDDLKYQKERRLLADLGFEHSVIERLHRRWRATLVADFMAFLPRPEFDVLRLLYWGELSRKDAARVLRVEPEQVKWLAESGRRRLRKMFEKMGVNNSQQLDKCVYEVKGERLAETLPTPRSAGPSPRTEATAQILQWLQDVGTKANVTGSEAA